MVTDEEYELFRNFLEERSGILLGDGKQYLIGSRLNRLLQEFQLTGFSEMMNCLTKQSIPGLHEKIIEAMTTNETMWFRDQYPYNALRDRVLPDFKHSEKSLRIWSSACSSGQEPYSISIILEEYLQKNPGAIRGGTEIIATDISTSILDEARRGHYNASAVARGVSEERLQKFFKKNDENWEVREAIKSRITFRQLNLKESYNVLGKFDLIFCRNVLIYFSHDLKADILERMSNILNPGGYLFLGSSEAPNRYSDKFQMERVDSGVIYRLK